MHPFLIFLAFLLVVVWFGVSAKLIANLWFRQACCLPKKVLWTVVLCLPVFGWILYGGVFTPPGPHSIEAQGKAGGWAPHWPKRW